MEFSGYISNWLGEWSRNALLPESIIFRMVLAFLFAAIIGSERASRRHAAGLRTFILVAMGCVMSGSCDHYMQVIGRYQLPLLSAAAVISQAMISTNSILFNSKNQLKGLTTTVTLWGTGINSLCLGYCFYDIAAMGFIMMLLCVALLPVLERFLKNHSALFEIHVELNSRNNLQVFITTLRKFGLNIEEIEYNPAFANSGLGVYTLQVTAGKSLCKQSHQEIIQALRDLDYVQFIEEI